MNMKKTSLQIVGLGFALLFIAIQALAQGGADIGGGDTDAANFVAYGKKLADWSLKNPQIIQPKHAEALAAFSSRIINRMDGQQVPPVQFVLETLRDPSGTPKMAIYQRDPLLIRVNRQSWRELTLANQLKLVALEYFGLVGIEDRYDRAHIVDQNAESIFGGHSLSRTEILEKSRPYLNTLFADPREKSGDSYQCGYHRCALKGDQVVSVEGDSIYTFEAGYMSSYKDTAEQFLDELPNRYLMDLYATGLIVTKKETRTGFSISMYFTPDISISRRLGLRAYDFADQIGSFLKFILAPDNSFTPEVKNLASRLQPSVQKLKARLDSKFQPASYSPLSELVNAKVDLIRKEIISKGCVVPSTFEAGNFEGFSKSLLNSYREKNVAGELVSSEAEKKASAEMHELSKLAAEISNGTRTLLELSSQAEGKIGGLDFIPLHAKIYGSLLWLALDTQRKASESEIRKLDEIYSELRTSDLCVKF